MVANNVVAMTEEKVVKETMIANLKEATRLLLQNASHNPVSR